MLLYICFFWKGNFSNNGFRVSFRALTNHPLQTWGFVSCPEVTAGEPSWPQWLSGAKIWIWVNRLSIISSTCLSPYPIGCTVNPCYLSNFPMQFKFFDKISWRGIFFWCTASDILLWVMLSLLFNESCSHYSSKTNFWKKIKNAIHIW